MILVLKTGLQALKPVPVGGAKSAYRSNFQGMVDGRGRSAIEPQPNRRHPGIRSSDLTLLGAKKSFSNVSPRPENLSRDIEVFNGWSSPEMLSILAHGFLQSQVISDTPSSVRSHPLCVEVTRLRHLWMCTTFLLFLWFVG